LPETVRVNPQARSVSRRTARPPLFDSPLAAVKRSQRAPPSCRACSTLNHVIGSSVPVANAGRKSKGRPTGHRVLVAEAAPNRKKAHASVGLRLPAEQYGRVHGRNARHDSKS